MITWESNKAGDRHYAVKGLKPGWKVIVQCALGHGNVVSIHSGAHCRAFQPCQSIDRGKRMGEMMALTWGAVK